MARFVALFLLAAVICTVYAFPSHESSTSCGRNEYFDSCGTACQPTCQNPNPQVCTLQCVAGCQCRQGFVRFQRDGECIPAAQCLARD